MKRICFIILLIPSSLFAQKDLKDWKEANLSVTKHQLNTGSGVLNYTATTGYMPIKDEKDTMKANQRTR
ncbi:MAG: hypothetical protein WDO71_03955 [Bacteroidota bacterium]